GSNSYNAIFNGSEAHIFLVDQKQAASAAKQDFRVLRSLGFEELYQSIKLIRSGACALDSFACFFNRLVHSFFIKWLKNIVYCIDFKSFNCILIKGCCEYVLGYGELFVQQFFENTKTIQARHLHIKYH